MLYVCNGLFQTMPCIHHCPLDFPPLIWHEMVGRALDARQSLNKPEDLTILTFNNTNEKMLLQKNLENRNVDYILLGQGIQKWSNPLKINLLVDALPSVKTKYVLVLDAIDVVISSDLGNIISDFQRLNCSVLYNASCVVYPRESRYSRMEEKIVDPKKSGFCHLNSGCFIGLTDFCLAMYERCSGFSDDITNEHHYSDQIKIKAMYVDLHPQMKIDYECKIFQVWNYPNIEQMIGFGPKML